MDPIVFQDMTWVEAKEAIPKARAIFIPMGSVEQHGYHLPLSTDNDLGYAFAYDCAKQLNGLVLPVMPFGQVWSAKDFPGCICLTSETLRNVLVEVAESCIKHGARAIVYVTGHNGNMPTMRDAARVLHDKDGFKNVWNVGNPHFYAHSKPLQETEMWNKTGMHAGEMETSLMLHYAPENVHLERGVASYPEVPVDYDFRSIPWPEYNEVGSFGDPSKATKEKGEKLAEAMIDDVVTTLDQVLPK